MINCTISCVWEAIDTRKEFHALQRNLMATQWESHVKFFSHWINLYLIKTKLRHGNIFTSVCQQFCPQGGGVCLSACWDTHPLDRYPPGQTPPGRPLLGRHPLGRHLPASRRLLLQAVCILLECFLVIFLFSLKVSMTHWHSECIAITSSKPKRHVVLLLHMIWVPRSTPVSKRCKTILALIV